MNTNLKTPKTQYLNIPIDPSAVPGNVPADPTKPRRRLLTPVPGKPGEFFMELDYSSLSNFLVCPHMFYKYSILGREAATDGSATSFGHLFHEIEEQRLRHGLTP